jgi:hypothetical protein
MAVRPEAPEGMSFHTQCIARVFSYYFLETGQRNIHLYLQSIETKKILS